MGAKPAVSLFLPAESRITNDVWDQVVSPAPGSKCPLLSRTDIYCPTTAWSLKVDDEPVAKPAANQG